MSRAGLLLNRSSKDFIFALPINAGLVVAMNYLVIGYYSTIFEKKKL